MLRAKPATMLRKNFLILLFSFWFQNIQCQHIQKALSQAGQIIAENKNLAKDKVKSVSERKSFSYSASQEEGESYFFDRKGNLTESRRYTDTGRGGPFYFIWKFAYNKENKLLKVTQTASNNPTNIYWEEHHYRKGATIVTGLSNSATDTLRRVELYYNKQGQHIKTLFYEPDSLIMFTHLNTFDKKGNKIQTATIWGPWKIEWVEIRNGKEVDPEKEIDEESEKAFLEDSREDGFQQGEEEEVVEAEPVYIPKKVKQQEDTSMVYWKYNAKGKMIEYTSGSNQSFYKVIYKYNQQDQLTETRQMDKKGRVYHKETFHYNKAGHLIEMDEFYEEAKPAIIHKYAYEYY